MAPGDPGRPTKRLFLVILGYINRRRSQLPWLSWTRIEQGGTLYPTSGEASWTPSDQSEMSPGGLERPHLAVFGYLAERLKYDRVGFLGYPWKDHPKWISDKLSPEWKVRRNKILAQCQCLDTCYFGCWRLTCWWMTVQNLRRLRFVGQ